MKLGNCEYCFFTIHYQCSFYWPSTSKHKKKEGNFDYFQSTQNRKPKVNNISEYFQM
jgi:hypothetical protein